MQTPPWLPLPPPPLFSSSTDILSADPVKGPSKDCTISFPFSVENPKTLEAPVGRQQSSTTVPTKKRQGTIFTSARPKMLAGRGNGRTAFRSQAPGRLLLLSLALLSCEKFWSCLNRLADKKVYFWQRLLNEFSWWSEREHVLNTKGKLLLFMY